MADTTYFKSSVSALAGFEQKVAEFIFYMHQRWAGSDVNQQTTIDLKQPANFCWTIVSDFPITDGPDIGSKLIARAQGVHYGVGKKEERWCVSFNISFEDERFKGSTLELRGTWDPPFSSVEWAIIGGTGQFRLAQGILKGKLYKSDGGGRDFDVTMRIFYRPFEI